MGHPEQTVAALLDAIDAANAVAPRLTAVLAGEVAKLGKLDWQAENTARGVELVRRLLRRHEHELAGGLDIDAVAFIVTAAVEGVANAGARDQPEMLWSGRLRRELTTMISSYLKPEP